jgi:hypothetical protein
MANNGVVELKTTTKNKRLGEAARQTGLGKTTLARAIKTGRRSAFMRSTFRKPLTDAAQSRLLVAWSVACVYLFKAPKEAPTEATGEPVAATRDCAGLQEVSDLLRRQLNDTREDLRRQLDDVRGDRDRWRTQAESAQRLLTDSRSWWRRMVS